MNADDWEGGDKRQIDLQLQDRLPNLGVQKILLFIKALFLKEAIDSFILDVF